MRTGRKHYVISAETDLPFAEAVNRAWDLLQDAGYGVLCEIDVRGKPKNVEHVADGGVPMLSKEDIELVEGA